MSESLLEMAFDGQSHAQHKAEDDLKLLQMNAPDLYEQGIEQQARYLGMDPVEDAKYLYIAKESLFSPVPEGWRVESSSDGCPYYYNETTGESKWEHPLDEHYKQMFQQLKQQDIAQQHYDPEEPSYHNEEATADYYSYEDQGLGHHSHHQQNGYEEHYDQYSEHQHHDYSAQIQTLHESKSYYPESNTRESYATAQRSTSWAPNSQWVQSSRSSYHGEEGDVETHCFTEADLDPLSSDRSTKVAYYEHHDNYTPAAEESRAEEPTQPLVNAGYNNYNEQQQKLDDLVDQNATLEREKEELQSELERLKQESNHFQKELESQTKHREETESTIEETQEQVNALQKHSEDLQSWTELLQEEKQQLEHALHDAQENLSIARKDAETFENQLIDFQSAQDVPGVDESVLTKLKETLNSQKKEYEDLMTWTKALESEKDTLETSLKEAQAIAEQAQHDAKHFHDQSLELQKSSEESSRGITEATEAAQAELAQWKVDYEALEEHFRNLKLEKDAQTTQLAVLEAQAQGNESQSASAIAELNQSVQSLNNQLNTEVYQKQEAIEMCEKLEQEVQQKDAEWQAAYDNLQASTTQEKEFFDTKAGQMIKKIETQKEKLATLAKDKEELAEALAVKDTTHAEELASCDSQIRELKREIRSLEREVNKVDGVRVQLENDLKMEKENIAVLQQEQQEMVAQQQEYISKAYADGQAAARAEASEAIRSIQQENAKYMDMHMKEMKLRRQLHNKIMELQGNIRVFCRVRPIQEIERNTQEAVEAVSFTPGDEQNVSLIVNDGNDVRTSNYSFEYDYVFQPSSSQEQVFEQTRDLVVSAMDGYNVCIFAYGQTGSGKTYTMEGSESNRGVNIRSMKELFRVRDERAASGQYQCNIKVSMLEVYNETIVDLLAETSGQGKKSLEIRVTKQGSYVENLIHVEVMNEKDVLELMTLGQSHRSVGSNNVNEHSSRSHLVVGISIEMTNLTDGRKTMSKLNMIDLAGSERVRKTAASGQRLKEAQNINRSLSALGDVIAALGNNSKHVPYRNSKLTFLLQDSLGGNSKVLMFVNISPVQWNAHESMCSLNFASRCRNVSLGQAKANAASTPTAKQATT